MRKIDGNVAALLQIKTSSTVNEIGERIQTWVTVDHLFGWLDLSSGDSKYASYDAKIQESTHIFILDYVELDPRVKAENSRMIINGLNYDVMLIDNPVGMNKHIEIYLKYTGGQ